MPYDMPRVPLQTLTGVRSHRPVTHSHQPATAHPPANDVAPGRADSTRPIEPMLLLHQERVETFRLIAEALRRGFRGLARSFAG